MGDIFQFIEENPYDSKEGFDMIYLHGVTQYFTNDEYFNNFLIATHKLLRKNGTLIIMDTPIDWYTEYMKSKPRCTLTFLFKEKIKSIIPTKLLDKIRVILKKKSISETVGNIEIKAPSFRGYWVNPETIQKFAESKFTNYEMNYQTFEHKPRIYKRVRPNFILGGKKQHNT